MLKDAHNRTIRDLRISLTDRCNFRCFYCLPNGEPPLARKETILSFEEIVRVSRIFVSLGIEKIRLTGGEPLIRRDVPSLVAGLAALKPELKDIALTTNGFDLPRHAAGLKAAGLDRVTLSLDSVDEKNFEAITGVNALGKVLDAIASAKAHGFHPVKVNAVIVRGRNDHEITALADLARRENIGMRFIEFMPLDSGHEWDRKQVVSGKEIFTAINERFPLELIQPNRGSETAWKYRFADGSPGEIGIIAPVTEMFCGACSRMRLTADGQIRTCLFSTAEHDLRSVVRSDASDDEIAGFIRSVTLQKEARHHINDPAYAPASRTMSFIGG
ncbi:MAG: GTP 3',8-cyclase MoaA [Pyrinomonadaceae bacterium]